MPNSSLDTAVIAWLRGHPHGDGHALQEIAAHFDIAPERLRDRLRRLVDQGLLAQSAAVTGKSDANPNYQLIADADGDAP
jgi:hypothetical protein